jgi:hypothetical protein
LITGKTLIGRTAIGSDPNSSTRVLHINRGRPFTSALQDPHFAALQFQRQASVLSRCA